MRLMVDSRKISELYSHIMRKTPSCSKMFTNKSNLAVPLFSSNSLK